MITPEQGRAARAWLQLTQGELAALADVHQQTVHAFETGKPCNPNKVARIERALATRQLMFPPEGVMRVSGAAAPTPTVKGLFD